MHVIKEDDIFYSGWPLRYYIMNAGNIPKWKPFSKIMNQKSCLIKTFYHMFRWLIEICYNLI